MSVPKAKDWLNSRILDAVVKAVQATKINSKHKHEFRVSGLPYCPLLDLTEQKQTKQEPSTEYDMMFYVSIGTAVHETFQKFARDAKSVSLIGNWRCNIVLNIRLETNPPSESKTICSQQYEFCSWQAAKKQHVCPHKQKNCIESFSYVEIELLYEGISGHIDLLVRIDNKYYILDIKTTSNYLFTDTKKAIEKGYYPSLKYWTQIETYAYIIEKLKNIKISQYAILYVSREHTSSRKNGHMLFVQKFTNDMRLAREARLNKAIKNQKLASKYAKKPSNKLLKNIWLNRPCQVKADYKNEMAYKFFNETCEYHQNGSCYSGKCLKTIEKLYKQ